MNELRGEELANAVLDYIQEHPEEWDQKNFFCGTTACFGGRAILLASGCRDEEEYRRWCKKDYHGSTESLARNFLGWTSFQAKLVFYNGTTDFAVLEQAVRAVLAGIVKACLAGIVKA